MTRHGPALLALTLLAIAAWTYNVNYDTRAALDRISDLRARIAEERETLQVLRVEWAWLNAPDRLARLVSRHNDELALVALTPEALGQVAAVPYPPDLPDEPEQSIPSDLLVAGAPRATMPAERAGVEIAPGQGGLLATADEVMTETAAIDSAATGQSGADATGSAAPDAAHTVLASAAGKAEALAGAGAGAGAAPATMREAVTLALIEAGVVVPGSAPAQASLMPASAEPGIPMPPARPAVWAER